MRNVYVWGTGKYYQWIKKYLVNVNIIGFISLWGEKEFEGKKVYNAITNEMMQDVDYLLIASTYTDDLVKNMIFTGFSEWDKVVVFKPTPLTVMLGLRSPESEIISENFFNHFSAEYGVILMPVPIWEITEMILPNTDPVRKYVLSMIGNEIYANSVVGDVAEFGVFTGAFAMELNMVFKDRKLLLFDTFEGFPKEDIEDAKEYSHEIDSFCENFKNTNTEIVMSKMRYPKQVEIYKGMFPQSTVNLDDSRKFAFVSIDVDFKENTLAGLRYFYPRLSSGGYIMIHDYNNNVFDLGSMVKAAIKEFECEIGHKVAKVPICDVYGTCVITKI